MLIYVLKDIVWKFNGIDLVADPKYEIIKAAKTDGVVSSLKIKDVVMDSFGDYSCSVTNDHGEDTKTVKLNRIGLLMYCVYSLR